MKVVVWGHKNNHTHHFIHAGFFRAFRYLGFETYWFDNYDDVSDFDFTNTIFFTEGQVDDQIPIIDNSKYILHNCNIEKYSGVRDNCISLLGPTKDVFNRFHNQPEIIEAATLTYFLKSDVRNTKTIVQPWATNLLPNEIRPLDIDSIRNNREKEIYFVGSIYYGDGYTSNRMVVNQLAKSAKIRNIRFLLASDVSDGQEHVNLIRKSWISPDVRSPAHVDCGYLACRNFKNISYGRIAGTNSRAMSELFENKIPYSNNIEELFTISEEKEIKSTQKDLNDLMFLVRDKHTYVNRINNILKVL